jgi:hypothetical protein
MVCAVLGPCSFDGERPAAEGKGYAQGIWELTDELIAQGVVPILRGFSTRWFPTSDPMCQSAPAGGYPHGTPFTATGTGPLLETIKRQVAEARQIPFASFDVRAAQVGATPPDTLQASIPRAARRATPCRPSMVRPTFIGST